MNGFTLEAIAEQEKRGQKPFRIRCCTSTGCQAVGALAVKQHLEARVQSLGVADQVQVIGVGCMGLCGRGPSVAVDPHSTLYLQVQPEQAAALVDPLARLAPTGPAPMVGDPDHPFFRRQLRVATDNLGRIDPNRVESYIAAGGYQTLRRVLQEWTPTEVVQAISQSGLRGRGGAGYPTGLKWATVAKMPTTPKYVVCNGDEGDPGAFMDRSVMESDPHRILEGMAIAGYAIGANQGFIYVRAEYPPAITRLRRAIDQAKRLGILGSQIFESPFDFRVDIRVGAGAYVCGEETALIASIQGERGIPRPRPPYPAEAGVWGSPTLINNVETLANIPTILRRGAEWFASIGTATSKGTKVFSLAGKVRNAGLIEVPMGITLREIVEEMGGADPGSIKAVQTGGPSGGCIPASALDTPVDYESLASLGSIMGSGGMVVLGHETSMVDLAHYFMGFCRGESCGKCIPCRTGTVQLHELLGKIRSRQGSLADLERLQQWCDLVKHTSLCGLGQAAPNPILSTLKYFRQDYLDLVQP